MTLHKVLNWREFVDARSVIVLELAVLGEMEMESFEQPQIAVGHLKSFLI